MTKWRVTLLDGRSVGVSADMYEIKDGVVLFFTSHVHPIGVGGCLFQTLVLAIAAGQWVTVSPEGMDKRSEPTGTSL